MPLTCESEFITLILPPFLLGFFLSFFPFSCVWHVREKHVQRSETSLTDDQTTMLYSLTQSVKKKEEK